MYDARQRRGAFDGTKQRTFSAGRLALADREERIIFWTGEYRSEPFLRKEAASLSDKRGSCS